MMFRRVSDSSPAYGWGAKAAEPREADLLAASASGDQLSVVWSWFRIPKWPRYVGPDSGDQAKGQLLGNVFDPEADFLFGARRPDSGTSSPTVQGPTVQKYGALRL